MQTIRVFAGPACGALEEGVEFAYDRLLELLQRIVSASAAERAREIEGLRVLCRVFGAMCADRADLAADRLQELGNSFDPPAEAAKILRAEITELRTLAKAVRTHEDHASGTAVLRMPRGPRRRQRRAAMRVAASAM